MLVLQRKLEQLGIIWERSFKRMQDHCYVISKFLNDVREYCNDCFSSFQRAWRDDKEIEICTVSLEFESGRAPLVRACDSRDFTRSPEPTKCAFREVEFPWIKKKIVFSKCFFALKYIKIIFFYFFKKLFLKSTRQNDMLTQKKLIWSRE